MRGRRPARFKVDRRGSVTVEFALLTVPFLMILLGLLELAVIYVTETSLQDALAREIRQIRTGQLQIADPPVTPQQFRTNICNNMQRVLVGAECDRIHIDVRAFSSFGASQPIPSPLNSDGEFDPDALVFQPGGPEQTIVARAFYEYPVSSPLTQSLLANLGNIRLITATELFRSEPFS